MGFSTNVATLEAETLKHETCVHCGMRYLYPLSRRAHGIGSSYFPFLNLIASMDAEEKANEHAYQRLKQKHANSFDPVRCPGCQGYQPQAIRELKRKRAWITLKVGLVATICTAPILGIIAQFAVSWLSAEVIWCVVLAELVLTVALAAGWWPLFNPGVGKTYLWGISPVLDDNVLTLEAHQAMVDARHEVRAQEELQAEERRAKTMAAQFQREANAAAKKQRQMQEMAERAKRDILEQGR